MEIVYYGEETKKALRNFGKGTTPPEIVRAYAEVKKAVLSAAQEREEFLPRDHYAAVMGAIDRVLSGEMDSQFVLPLKQGGAGTSINMNLNEVIAGIANRSMGKDAIDPIDHVNHGQSTNDTFPTAVTVVLYRKLEETERKIVRLQEDLIRKETEYGDVLMAGRTEMQTALPITLGQVFASWAGGVERDRWRFNKLRERIRTVALGGTAVGTGFGARIDTVLLAEKYLRAVTGLPLNRSQNLTDEVASQDKLSELAGGLKLAAENIFKMTGDLLIYTSSAVGEIRHSSLQYGSTIMAAKTNPVLLELARGLAIDVIHETGKISEYCRNGQLQLNAFLPFILHAFIDSFESLGKALDSFNADFLQKMEIDRARIAKNLLDSGLMLNLLLPALDYRRVKELYETCLKEKPSDIAELKNIVNRETGLPDKDLDRLFDPVNATTFFKEKP